MENEIQEEPKNYKTSEKTRERCLSRYRQKKAEILQLISLKAIMSNGKIPSQSQILKHNLSWEDIAKGLQEYIKEHPVTEVDARITILEERKELSNFKRLIQGSGIKGSKKVDDITTLYKKYHNCHQCENCLSVFTKENNRRWNIDESTGYFKLILCDQCTTPEKNNPGEQNFEK